MLISLIGQIGVVCEGMKDSGGCGVYFHEGVAARNYRTNVCAYQEFRKPIVVTKANKVRVGQQKSPKQIKHKAKAS
jgi:hypothetical protein